MKLRFKLNLYAVSDVLKQEFTWRRRRTGPDHTSMQELIKDTS